MPYSDYAVQDRQAVAQLRYQIRRFIKQMRACDTEQVDIDRIAEKLNSALSAADGVIDYDNDGSRLEEQE